MRLCADCAERVPRDASWERLTIHSKGGACDGCRGPVGAAHYFRGQFQATSVDQVLALVPPA